MARTLATLSWLSTHLQVVAVSHLKVILPQKIRFRGFWRAMCDSFYNLEREVDLARFREVQKTTFVEYRECNVLIRQESDGA
jgi:hypothetical protein